MTIPSRARRSTLRRLACAVCAVTALAPSLAAAQSTPTTPTSPTVPAPSGAPTGAPNLPVTAGVATGVVVDARDGLPLGGAAIEIPGTTASTITSDKNGRFTLPALPNGTYRARVSLSGYQPAYSSSFAIANGRAPILTLALERVVRGASGNLQTIGVTSTRASESLQRSSTVYRTLSADALAATGTYRAADALRTLPGSNNGITGDTASLGDDVQLNLRGLGTRETLATLDGHPIGEGAYGGGYNYELTPIFALRDIVVNYGSGGSDLLGLNAIGGIVDQRTLDPTPGQHAALQQGFGTFSKVATSLNATGTVDRLGYAVAAGVSTVDGPYKNDYYYQPGAAYDQSATNPAVRNLAVYKLDSTLVQRAALIKLRYEIDPKTHVQLTHVAENSFDDKTGNGDADYLPGDTVLALGNQQLTNKGAKDTCPAGTFTATNINGVANGTGPGGIPDGGIKCQTPAQYAAFNTGLQGVGTSYQNIDFNDEALRFDTAIGANAIRLDAFTNRYLDTTDRAAALPFSKAPGDSPQASLRNANTVETGTSLSDTIALPHNDVGFGFTYLNNAYYVESFGALKGAPIYHDTATFVRDVARFDQDRFTVYANAWFKRSTATNTSYVDPRLSVVYTPTSRDVFRIAAGANTAQPSSDMLGQQFTYAAPGGAGGGAAISCTSPNTIGTAPSTVLLPERGVDEEIAYGHRWQADSQTQFAYYNTNVYDKIFKTTLSLAQTGTAFVTSAQLAAAEAAIASRCGASANPLALLGVSGNVNVAQERGLGFQLSGRQRLSRAVYVDYDYDVTSAALISAPASVLKSNLTYVPGAQIAHIPLHTGTYAIDATLPKNVELRLTVYTVSANNTKSLPAYNYSDIVASAPVGPGTLNVAVSNLFNNYAFIQGLRGDGVPLALNQYATAASYTPLIGSAATEEFGLPDRQIFFGYTLRTK